MKRHSGHKHKHWLLIQKLDKAVEDFATTPAAWKTVYKVRGSIVTPQAFESVTGERVSEHISHIIDIRWLPNINSSYRVVLEDKSLGNDDAPATDRRRSFEIKSAVDLKARKRYLTLQCMETTATFIDPGPTVTPAIVGDAWIWQNSDQHIWQDGSTAVFQ